MNEYILGDAFDHLPNYPADSVSLLFTSVPDLSETHKEKNSIDFYKKFLDAFIEHATRLVKKDGFIVLSQTDRKMKGKIIPKHNEFINLLNEKNWHLKDYKILVKDRVDKINLYRLNFSHVLIFTKQGKISADKRKGQYLKDVWVYPYPKGVAFDQSYSDFIVKTFSNENELVFDPFAGRGTVVKSCLKLNRFCIGVEFDKDIYDRQYVYGNKLTTFAEK